MYCVQLGDSESESDWSMSSGMSSSSDDEEGSGLFRYTAEYFLKKLVTWNTFTASHTRYIYIYIYIYIAANLVQISH